MALGRAVVGELRQGAVNTSWVGCSANHHLSPLFILLPPEKKAQLPQSIYYSRHPASYVSLYILLRLGSNSNHSCLLSGSFCIITFPISMYISNETQNTFHIYTEILDIIDI